MLGEQLLCVVWINEILCIRGVVESLYKENMMDLSIFLGRVVGLYLVIVGLAWLTRKEFLKVAVEDFFNSAGLMFVTGLLTLIIGLLMVVGHNVWELSWRVVITVVGYLSLIKGFAYLYAPYKMVDFSKGMMRDGTLKVLCGVIIAVGAWLLYCTF